MAFRRSKRHVYEKQSRKQAPYPAHGALAQTLPNRGENQENCTGNQKYQQPMVPMCQPTTVVAGHTRWLLFTFGNIGFIFFIQPSLIVSKIMRNFAAV